MYIVRWLMGHPIVATWVLAAVAILLTFGSGNKAGDDIVDAGGNNAISNNSEVLKAEIDSKSGDEKIANSLVVEASTAVNSKALQGTEKAIANPKAEVNTVAKDVKSKQPPFDDNANENTTTKNEINTESSLNTKSTAVADLGQSTSEEMLLMAREAYWNNGLDEAAQIYEKLIEIEPKVLEHKGELGNVYWRQGYPKKAAELYSDIAIPMIEKGGVERVSNMIGFIGLFYPDRAAEIHKRIQSSKQK